MNIKRYVPIIIGIVALCAVLYIGSKSGKDADDIAVDEQASSTVMNKSFQGSITKEWEGSNTLAYGFDLPETATATISMNGALVKVTDADAPVLAMYVSFEGARGYSPEDYIAHNIVPKVSSITSKDTVTIGEYEWSVAESQNSEWHIAKVANGNWLLVVENTKANSEQAKKILESLSASMPTAVAPVSATENEAPAVEATPSEKK